MKLPLAAFGGFLVLAFMRCNLAQEYPGTSDEYVTSQPEPESPTAEADDVSKKTYDSVLAVPFLLRYL